MKFILSFLTISTISLFAYYGDYQDNHSCSECHQNIYDEYQLSSHSKGYFNNSLHRQIADEVSNDKYECATCHMPSANNMRALTSGWTRPSIINRTHTDAISCYFCHTIAYVKKSHKFNINLKARQARNYKPTLYGGLKNPEHNDKHSSSRSPVYAQKVCTGCHSHKLNDNDVTLFKAMDENQNSIGCIKCHMPMVSGGAEKMDKKARGEHLSHKFLGIHDKEFRATGLDIKIYTYKKELFITLQNKMEHPLIIQPARAKFIKIELYRDNKLLWQNYADNPMEDKQSYFAYNFTKNNHKIIIPTYATASINNNIGAKKTKALHYNLTSINKGDKIVVSLFVQLAKNDCSKVIELENRTLMEHQLMKKEIYIQK